MVRWRWRALLTGLVLFAGALGALALTEAGAPLLGRLSGTPFLARLSAPSPEPARAPPTRIAVEDGRTVVRLTAAERARIGLATAWLPALPHALEVQGYGSVLDLARVTELTNAYAGAVAALQTARARAEVSASAARRAKNLGAYATAVQVETTEGTFLTDQAAVTAAESQVRTLSATARQEWGAVIGAGIVARSALVTRLIERTDFLMQVTLPPGESLAKAPAAAFAEVPPQSVRARLTLVSPATRTDPRIQGQSFFYTVPGESGLLPGMSTLAFLDAGRVATGVRVPEDAVVHGEGGTWVYRGLCPAGEGTARLAEAGDAPQAPACTAGYVRHPVRADAPMSDDAFVVEDLPGGAEIVLTGGQALLSEEMRSRIRVSGDDDD